MESINNRRTIRKYKQEDISASLLNDLLEKAFVLLQWVICNYIV